MPPIFVISGVPGAGKTSVCKALLRRFAFGLHLPVDDLREFVVSGMAHPVPQWTAETGRQFGLARVAAGKVAVLYHRAGFAVAIDDVLGSADAEAFGLPKPHKVLLCPDLEVVLKRNAGRTNKAFDTAFLETTIRHLYASQDKQAYLEAGWRVLDTSALDPEETATAILEQAI